MPHGLRLFCTMQHHSQHASHPAPQELATGEWVVDSGVICDYLEGAFPQPPLGTVEGSPQM